LLKPIVTKIARLPGLALFFASGKRFVICKGGDLVSSLAYVSLVSLVPLLAIMISIFSMSPLFEPLQNLVLDMVFTHFIPDSQPVVAQSLNNFAQQASRLALPGLLAMWMTTLLLLWHIDQKVNSFWQVRRERSWLMVISKYLAISLLGPLLLGAGLFASSSLMAYPIWQELNDYEPVRMLEWLKLVPLIVGFVVFFMVFKWVPSAFISWQQAGLVAIMASIQFELLKRGFAWFIQAFPTYDLVYGALAALPLFLLWLYLIWWIVLWNTALLAEMNCQQDEQQDELTEQA
jgi:membrane protein